MEVNKEEALRCLDIAKGYFRDGNFSKALKLFKKSYSMYPTDAAQHWIEKTLRESKGSGGASRTSRPSSSATPSPPSTDKPISKRQREEVERIMKAQGNYYQVLKIDRKASTKDIEKAYKKVSLPVLCKHPTYGAAVDSDSASGQKRPSTSKRCL